VPISPREVSVAIPTYRRGDILLRTLDHLFRLDPPPGEILVVDQTEAQPAEVERELRRMESEGRIRLLRFSPPSIPRAMNTGLREAKGAVVLFVDDDVEPARDLVAAHAARYAGGCAAVCGQVLQPGEVPDPAANAGPRAVGFLADLDFRFCGTREAEVANVISCNLSVDRAEALAIGGFDEQFIGSAYRYETDFARRLAGAGRRILFAPEASVRHLRLATGGTRSQGDHLARPSPLHSFGDYYFAFRHARGMERAAYVARRLFRETINRYSLRHPGVVPRKCWSEVRAMAWAWRRRKQGLPLAVPRGNPKMFYDDQYRGDRYAAYASPAEHPFHRELEALIARHAHADGKWLEVGCGRGFLQDVVVDYTGVDLSESVAAFLHKPFRCAPAEALPFADGQFDGIWSYAVLEHVADPERALMEIRRVLKPGGILLLAPAWQCRPWAGRDYAWKPFRELPLADRMRKAAIPLRESVAFRALGIAPRRLARWAGFMLRRQPVRFHSRRLTPCYTEYRVVDADALHSMDPFDVILWFRSRGDRVLSHPGWGQALAIRSGALAVEVRKP
jgi:SAM-dependent methyltransferase/GT2 family glycosyltransferase